MRFAVLKVVAFTSKRNRLCDSVLNCLEKFVPGTWNCIAQVFFAVFQLILS